KKTYLRIYTNSTGGRKTAIKAVQDNNFETASDDLYSFHRKVARENGIQLSGWSIINKYIYKQGKGTSPLYKHEFDVSIKDFCPLEDITTISDRFPISALLRDRTLVITWDIETQSQELGEFAEVLDLNHNVFMICMTLHWKDDPKPLKQISIVDVEAEPDPRWTTIVCGNQENLLKAFALYWRAFAPDIQVGFNDSDYDWHFIMERAYHLNILEWMWERMTGKFERKKEIIKWKYRGKIGAKSENDYMKKYPVKAPEKGEEDPEEKEYMGGPIKIKIRIETVKQGKSQLLKFIGEKIMREAMDINNTRPIHEIVKDTLREARNKEWDFNEFIIMGTWKPKKNNLCNNRFMGRMRERNERIPDPGEHFSYVVVKGPRLRNEKGRLIPYRVGDYMEYADIAKEQNMEIDINYYLGTTVGMCARFINEDDSYQPPSSHKIMQIKDSDVREKKIDKYSQDEAERQLKKYIKTLQ
ncbi:hypothetical protein RhiirB3_395034, partial [Rhizophagus irregularis]